MFSAVLGELELGQAELGGVPSGPTSFGLSAVLVPAPSIVGSGTLDADLLRTQSGGPALSAVLLDNSAIVVIDPFDRDVTAGWGRAPNGKGHWTMFTSDDGVDPGVLSVVAADGEALITDDIDKVVDTEAGAYLKARQRRNVTFGVMLGIKSGAGTNPYVSYARVLQRFNGDTGFLGGFSARYYVLDVGFWWDHTVHLAVRWSHDQYVVDDFTTDLTWAEGDLFCVEFRVARTDPTHVKARIWRFGDLKPYRWRFSVTDSAGPQVAGYIGLSVISNKLNNKPIVTRFKFAEAYDLDDSSDLDAVIWAQPTSGFGLDAVLHGAQAGSLGLDALLYAPRTDGASLDAFLFRFGAATLSLDAVLGAQRAGAFTFSALLAQHATAGVALSAVLARQEARSAAAAAVIQATPTGSFGLAALLATAPTGSLGLDATLRAQRAASFGLGAFLFKPGVETLSLDAVLEARQASSFALSALLSTQRGASFGLDALVAHTPSATVALNADIRATVTRAIGLSAISRKTVETGFALEARISVARTDGFGLSAAIVASRPHSTTLAAIIRGRHQGGLSLAALLQRRASHTAALDAVVARSLSESFGLSALLRPQPGFSLQAVLRSVGAADVGFDAILTVLRPRDLVVDLGARTLGFDLDVPGQLAAEITARILDHTLDEPGLNQSIAAEELSFGLGIRQAHYRTFGLAAVLE